MLRSKGVAATIHAIAPISVLTFWLFRSSSHLLSHDVAWFLFGSERMVDGASLYRDVIDVNPPLVFYLGVPAAWLQHALGWSDIVLYRLGVLAAIVLSLWLCNHFSRVLLAEFVPATHRHLTMLLAVLLTTLAASDFGQREHIMIVLVLPYILLCSVRILGRQVPPVQAFVVGFMGGIGLALKPYFLILPLSMELLILIGTKHLHIGQRIEMMVIIAIQLLYYASILIFHSEYINVIVKMGKLYEAYNATWEELISNRASPLWFLSTVLVIVMRSKREGKAFRDVSYVAGSAFFVIALLQRKGWVYHFYPAMVILSLFVFSSLYVAATSGKRWMFQSMLRGLFKSEFAIPLLLLIGMVTFDGFWSARKKPYADLIPYVEERAREKPIFVFSTSLTPAFPVINYSHARWPWRFSSLWFLPGFYEQARNVAGGVFSYHSRAQMDTLEKQFFDGVLEDLIANHPVLMVRDTSAWHQGFGRTRFDFLEYYGQDQRFSRFIAQYVDQVRIGQYLIMEKQKGIAHDAGLHALD